MPAPHILSEPRQLPRLTIGQLRLSVIAAPAMNVILSFTLAAIHKSGPAPVMRILIENGQVWQEDGFVSGQTLTVADGLIHNLKPASEIRARPNDRRLDARGACVMPGFVDLHLHGSNGFDIMDATEDSLRGLCAFLVRQGVTSYLGTTMSDSAERIEAALSAMRDFADRPNTPLLGIHLEGPYLNPDFRGSQPDMHLRPPRREEYLPWLKAGQIKLITLAPEIPGGDDLIRDARAQGVTVAMGHSGASYEAAHEFFAEGVRQITHTFNGMAGIHHRRPGIFVAACERPEVTFQVIADGVHVHPAVLRLILRLVGTERVLAITDAMQAAGLADGRFALGDVSVHVKDGIARAGDGGLAGSTLTMPRALQNMMRFCDLTLAEALPTVTRTPADSIGMYPQKGSLQTGTDADIVIWDEEEGVQATLIAGELMYPAEAECTAAIADG